MKRGVIISILLISLLFVIMFVFAQTHTPSEVLVSINSYTMTIQEAINNNFLVQGTPAPTTDYTTSLSLGHDASEIWVSVDGNEMTLEDAANATNTLCGSFNTPYVGSINPGHLASEIPISIGGFNNLQEAIDDGEFCGSGLIVLTISSDTPNYNIFSAAGNPTTLVNIELTINSGVTVYSTNVSNASLKTGPLPAGSSVSIINNGSIIGKGGDGGDALDISPISGGPPGTVYDGVDGEEGGDALELSIDVTLDNTNGNIFGGAGGGGSGVGYGYIYSGFTYRYGAGGGGGGAGYNGGTGGTGGTTISSNLVRNGGSGNSGGITGGSGGAGGYVNYIEYAGNGGTGGGYGQNGDSGFLIGWCGPGCGGGCAPACTAGIVGSGGIAGQAISLNGNSITWLGGNNPAQVIGSIV